MLEQLGIQTTLVLFDGISNQKNTPPIQWAGPTNLSLVMWLARSNRLPWLQSPLPICPWHLSAHLLHRGQPGRNPRRASPLITPLEVDFSFVDELWKKCLTVLLPYSCKDVYSLVNSSIFVIIVSGLLNPATISPKTLPCKPMNPWGHRRPVDSEEVRIHKIKCVIKCMVENL